MKNELHAKLLALGLIILVAGGVLFFIVSKFTNKQSDSVNSKTINPSPASSGNITVTQPLANDLVSQDFQVTGKARVFENIVSIRVKSKLTGQVYLLDTTPAYGGRIGKFVDFSYIVHLSSQSNLRPGDKLILEVFQNSAKDGSEIDKVSIPIQFTPALE